jgi:hypothetical protein
MSFTGAKTQMRAKGAKSAVSEKVNVTSPHRQRIVIIWNHYERVF